MIASTGRILWSPEALKIIYRFCAKYQASGHHLPSPEQLKELLDELNAPSDPDAFKDAAKRTLGALTSRVSNDRAMVALKETSQGRGQWTCEWYVWSERWFKNEMWNGDISIPQDLTIAERMVRAVIPKRHDLGTTRLIQAVAAVKRQEVISIAENVKDKGDLEDKANKEREEHELQQTAAALSVAEARILELEQQAADFSRHSANNLMQANNRVEQLQDQVQRGSTQSTAQPEELQAAKTRIQRLEQQIQHQCDKSAAQSEELNAANAHIKLLERQMHQKSARSTTESQELLKAGTRIQYLEDRVHNVTMALSLAKNRVLELEAGQSMPPKAQSVHFAELSPPSPIAPMPRRHAPTFTALSNLGAKMSSHHPSLYPYSSVGHLSIAEHGLDTGDHPVSCYSESPDHADQNGAGTHESDGWDGIV